MTASGDITYKSTYRRTAMVLPTLAMLVVLLLLVLWLITETIRDGNDLMTAAMVSVGVFVLVVVLVAVAAFRIHAWTLEAGGIRIVERPKVPLFGRHRQAFVPFAQFNALRWLESGFDRVLEIATADGHRYQLMKDSLLQRDPGDRLEAFAAAIRSAALRDKHDLPAMSEGLSWWNSKTGIGFLGLVFVASCLLAGVVAWALWDGMTTSPGSRGPQAAAVALALPLGCGYLLRKSIARRRRVLGAPGSK